MENLLEYANGMGANPQRPLIEMFAQSSDILSIFPFSSMPGAMWEGTREASIATGAFRAINEAATTGSGEVEPFSEASFIMDHHIDIDVAIVRRQGEQRRAQKRKSLLTSYGRLWVDTLIAGDNSSERREFDGLQVRCNRWSRNSHNSTASGGAALSLLKLDQALNAVAKPTHILVPYDSKPLWIGAARNTSLSGFVIQSWDEVGTPKMSYAGIPFLFGYPKDDHTPVLRFNEVGAGGGAAVTASLYILSIGEMGLHGIQHSPLSVVDKGLLEDGITLRDHLSWDCGIVDEHKYCIHRLDSWTNTAIVA